MRKALVTAAVALGLVASIPVAEAMPIVSGLDAPAAVAGNAAQLDKAAVVVTTRRVIRRRPVVRRPIRRAIRRAIRRF